VHICRDERTISVLKYSFIILLQFLFQHPVYCIQVVGTQNAHNLISISTDGRLCCWSLDMLTQPVERLDLTAKQSKSVSVSAFAFLHDDVNKFVFGSQEGAAYSGRLQ